jgi:hypothetical protein
MGAILKEEMNWWSKSLLKVLAVPGFIGPISHLFKK